MVLLIERKHWATVNRFITTRLDKEVYPYSLASSLMMRQDSKHLT